MKSSTIEFFARPVEKSFNLTQHLYIVSTDSQGHQRILRAGPETDKGTGMLTDDLKVIYTDYLEANRKLLGEDLNTANRVKVYAITGTDEEIQNKINKMWEIGQKINLGNYDYKLPIPGCSESICHVQNSNTAANLFAKAVNIDLKPELEKKDLWAPGIDGHLDHTNIDKFVCRAIDALQKMQKKISNNVSGLGGFIKHSKERLEQFSANKSEHYSAVEGVKFDQLMKDCDMGLVLSTTKSYKYYIYWNWPNPIGEVKYYCNAAIECHNQRVNDCQKLNLTILDKYNNCQWELKKLNNDSIEYEFHNHHHVVYYGYSCHPLYNNSFYDPDYLTTTAKQCNALSSFRDDKSSPFCEQIDSICSFEGLNNLDQH